MSGCLVALAWVTDAIPIAAEEMSIHLSAISLLLNLEAARRGRSVLFSDEQKLLFEGRKKGFAKNTKLDFMIC
jgi:hypothetical protein